MTITLHLLNKLKKVIQHPQPVDRHFITWYITNGTGTEDQLKKIKYCLVLVPSMAKHDW